MMRLRRHLLPLFLVGGGWAAGAMMTCVATACLAAMWERPEPRVVILNPDGSYEAPALIDDRTKSRKQPQLLQHSPTFDPDTRP